MTCILSMPRFYLNHFNENVADIQNDTFQYLDFNWMIYGCQHSVFLKDKILCDKCKFETDKGATELPNRISENAKQEHNIVLTKNICIFETKGNIIEKQSLTNGKKDLTNPSDISIRADSKQGQFYTTKCGMKRKTDTENCTEVYIPSKRMSPFINTPKERKDESKIILNISKKKIKMLDDPENFLRKSVLINNLTKRLQTELRQEKQSNRTFTTYKRKCFSDYKVLKNSCLSESYLCDDPFLNVTHEAITDDMTDTLINNVLNDNESKETQWASC